MVPISTIPVKAVVAARGVGGRFGRLGLVRRTVVAGYNTGADVDRRRAVHLPSRDDAGCGNGYKRCHSGWLASSSGFRKQKIRRPYSSSAPKNSTKSGEEHHALFREQLMDLEREQKRFGPKDDDDDDDSDGGNFTGVPRLEDFGKNHDGTPGVSSPVDGLGEQLDDWKSEQLRVFGETLADRDNAGNSPETSPNNETTEPDPEERESRFEFTQEDLAAWGKPNPGADAMQHILDQVAAEREKEADYAKSAASLTAMTTAAAATAAIATTTETNCSGNGQSNNSDPSTAHHHESFSHVSEDGAGVHMVDVGRKAVTPRMAHARTEVWLPPDVLEAFLPKTEAGDGSSSSPELVGPKGPIFATAKIAGIMAAKKTSDLIPLCHPLPLDQVQLDIKLKDDESDEAPAGGGTVVVDCRCRVTHKTGVEMEALTGATVAALTIYDMTKAVSHNIRIRDTRLIGKTGGKRTVLDGIEE